MMTTAGDTNDKDISKKPIKITYDSFGKIPIVFYKCPTCGYMYCSIHNEYCGNCGQKFDLEGYEED